MRHGKLPRNLTGLPRREQQSRSNRNPTPGSQTNFQALRETSGAPQTSLSGPGGTSQVSVFTKFYQAMLLHFVIYVTFRRFSDFETFKYCHHCIQSLFPTLFFKQELTIKMREKEDYLYQFIFIKTWLNSIFWYGESYKYRHSHSTWCTLELPGNF